MFLWSVGEAMLMIDGRIVWGVQGRDGQFAGEVEGGI